MQAKVSVQNAELESLLLLRKVLAALSVTMDFTKVIEEHLYVLHAFQDERQLLLE